MGEDRRYHAIDLDEQGGLELESVGLRIGPDPDGWGLKIVDRSTGQRLLTLEEERVARETAEKRAEEEARRAEEEVRRAAEEAQARQVAEKQAAEEAQARKALEDKLGFSAQPHRARSRPKTRMGFERRHTSCFP